MTIAPSEDRHGDAIPSGWGPRSSVRQALLAGQNPDGLWRYELEADCTIPPEHFLFLRYLGRARLELDARIASYLRARQGERGRQPEHRFPDGVGAARADGGG